MTAELNCLLQKVRALPEFIGVSVVGVQMRSTLGDTPLHIACIWGDVSAVELLLSAGADLNAIGEHGYTPLHEASEQGHPDCVRKLLRAGARADIKSDDGDTAQMIAERGGDPEVVSAFSQGHDS